MVDEIDPSRRAFFRRAAGKAAEKVVEHAQAKIEARATRWIRPPFALPELEFILACTRCGDCIEACPHEVLFPLAASFGADVASTAALDVLNGGCHLCEDWPCVTACEPDALIFPPDNQTEIPSGKRLFPKLAHAEIISTECLPYQGPECGACEGSCPVPDALVWQATKPTINMAYCVGCGLCREACIANPPAIMVQSLNKNKHE